jgi:hypothetical protein
VVRFPPATSGAVSVTGNQPFEVQFPSLVSVRFPPPAFVFVCTFSTIGFASVAVLCAQKTAFD